MKITKDISQFFGLHMEHPLPGGWTRTKTKLPKLGAPSFLSFIRIDGTAGMVVGWREQLPPLLTGPRDWYWRIDPAARKKHQLNGIIHAWQPFPKPLNSSYFL